MKKRMGTLVTRHSPLLYALFLILLSPLLTIHSSLVYGQTESASLSGTIVDGQGALVPDVQVSIVNTDTNVSFETKSNGAGIYNIPFLKPGHYRILVNKEGFKQIDLRDVTLNVQDSVNRNFTLELGGTSETIIVNGDTLNINTQSAAVSTLVDRNFVESIPLNGRSLQPLITLTPGVVLTPASTSEQGQFSVNGQRSDSNYFMVDGVSANFGAATPNGVFHQSFGGSLPALSSSGGTNTLVSIDAIQEFRIQTSSYAPEFGRSPGGQISIATRSGTSQFHGDLFEYFRNDVLDASDWFNGFLHNPPLPKAAERQNDFGGVFGGPLLKDKTFFFFSYEGLRLRQPETGDVTVPTVATRMSAPASVQPLLNALPIPNGQDFGNGNAEFVKTYSSPSNLNAVSLRLDHKLTGKVTVFARYNYAPSDGNTRIGSLSTVSPFNNKMQTGTAGSTQILTARITNDFRFNYSYNSVNQSRSVDSFGGAVPPADTLLFPAGFGLSNRNSTFEFDIFGSGVFLVGRANANSQRQLNFVDGMSVSVGAHQLKFGIDYRRLTPTYVPPSYFQGLFFFGVSGPFGVTSGNIGFSDIESNEKVSVISNNISLYGQDTWKLNPRLTLTYGVRWEIDPALYGAKGTPLYTAQNVNDPTGLTVAPVGTSIFKTTYGNVAPRVGVAVQLSNAKGFERVLRAGFGTFYDLPSGEFGNNFSYPYNSVSPNINFGASYPLSPNQTSPPPLPGSPAGQVLSVADPNLRLPRTYEWNAALEQSLGATQVLTLTYVGARGDDLLRWRVFSGSNPPGFGQVQITTNQASSNYNALQVQYQRRLSRGFQALGSYSWSHSIDDASNASTTFGPNPELDRGSSDFDIRHSFHGVITYDIPTPKMGYLGKAVLRGWSVDTTVAAQSAPPVDISTGSRINSPVATFGVRPDILVGIPLYLYGPQYPGGRAINSTPGQGTCTNGSPSVGPFCNPPQGQQGNLGRNSLRGFGVTQIDFALRREFNITERWNLQFSAEVFNILNHPNFGNIDNCTCDAPGTFGQATQTLAHALSSDAGSLGGGFNPLYQVGGARSLQLALKLKF